MDATSKLAVGARMSDRARLVLLSFLMLFVELALIRWLGANVLYLSYFSNFVLLGSFLGIGIGFLRSKSSVDLSRFGAISVAGLAAFATFFPVQINRSNNDLLLFGGEPEGLPMWLMLPIIFVGVAFVMCTVGEGVGRTFAKFEPLQAYRLDILGSLAGIAMFSVLSFLRAPSVAWGVVVAILFLVTANRITLWFQLAPVIVLVALLVSESLIPGVSWSPYYKVKTDERLGAGSKTVWDVSVNGIPHQRVESMSERLLEQPVYGQPYEVGNPSPKEVLVIGAGTGVDLAVALDKGATHIDAVEIDPRIQEIGEELHPNHPYDDPRVDVHIDDGRSFLESTDRKYDLVVLALPDSLTLVSGQSSLRLESYLFTKQAFEAARDHLKPGGVFTMYNFYRESWLRDRYANTLREVYGHSPCVATFDAAQALAVMTISLDESVIHCPTTWVAGADTPGAASDDHPFPYLKEASIPTFYLLPLGLILLVAILSVRLVSGGLHPMTRYGDLFCMGVAFLLLETKSVVQFALLFGTTWFVNALVFAGVLLSVYLAVELSLRVRMPKPIVLYAGLMASIAVAYAVPLGSLLTLDRPVRFAVAVTLTFAPIFFANLIFAQRFRDVGSSTTAFGANLLGAMVGGIIEYAALITGYRNLLLVVALFYGLAFAIGRATWMRAGAADLEPGSESGVPASALTP